MMYSHPNTDMIILKSRLGDIDRGFQPTLREYGKPGLGVIGKATSVIASLAAVSLVLVQSGIWG